MSDTSERVRENSGELVEKGGKEGKRLELVAIIVLALATVLTAWSGFQSQKWSGVQASSYTQAGGTRSESNRVAGFGFIIALNTQVNFNQWLDATLDGDEERAAIFEERLEDLIPDAWNAWLALDPLNNLEAPDTPLLMPEYQSYTAEQTADLDNQADDLFDKGQDANQTSDNYVMTTMFFAVALFFSGISMSLDIRRARIALLVVAAGLVLVAGIWVLTMPVEL